MGKYIREFRVYALLRPDGRPFYIGKGSRRRRADHLREARNGGGSLKCKIIRRIISDRQDVGYLVVRDCASADEAFALECDLISKYGRLDLGTGILANHTNGGDGVSGHSQETIAILRAKTTEQMTQAARARLRDAAKEKLRDPAYVKRHSLACREAARRPEVLEANRARGNLQAARSGERERLSRVSREYNSTPEARTVNSSSLKALWADPAWRSKVLAAQARGKAARRAKLDASN